METYTIGKKYFCDADNLNPAIQDINELDIYIKSKEQPSNKGCIEEGMSFDEITEVASNRIANTIRKLLDIGAK